MSLWERDVHSSMVASEMRKHAKVALYTRGNRAQSSGSSSNSPLLESKVTKLKRNFESYSRLKQLSNSEHRFPV